MLELANCCCAIIGRAEREEKEREKKERKKAKREAKAAPSPPSKKKRKTHQRGSLEEPIKSLSSVRFF